MALLAVSTPFCCFSSIVSPFDQDYFLRKLWWSIIRKHPWTINEKATLIPITRQAHCWYAMSHTGGKAVFWVYNRRVYGNTWATRTLVGSRVKSHIPQIKSSFVEVVSVAFIHCNIWALGYFSLVVAISCWSKYLARHLIKVPDSIITKTKMITACNIQQSQVPIPAGSQLNKSYLIPIYRVMFCLFKDFVFYFRTSNCCISLPEMLT